MNYLLDTHVLVWHLLDNDRLSDEAKHIIQDPNSIIYYSVINIWEILIKSNKEKLILYRNINNLNADIIDIGFILVPLYPRTMSILEDISKNNKSLKQKNPFDRVLMAQAKDNKMFLLTHDKSL